MNVIPERIIFVSRGITVLQFSPVSIIPPLLRIHLASTQSKAESAV